MKLKRRRKLGLQVERIDFSGIEVQPSCYLGEIDEEGESESTPRIEIPEKENSIIE